MINVNITDITDESGCIDSIGKMAAAEAINRAKIDVAEQEKLGAIGEAEATPLFVVFEASGKIDNTALLHPAGLDAAFVHQGGDAP